MSKSVIFYNHFGNGDIFESREFVKEYMEKIPADNYYYAHGKNPKILADMPLLGFTEVTDVMDPRHAAIMTDDILYINTWIGRDGKYVLPGIGCVVESLYHMHNEILTSLKFEPLRKEMIDYVPDIDYSYYDVKTIDEFHDKYGNRKVLVSNGPVQSSQAKNFDFTPAIEMMAKTFPDILFILTSPTDIKGDNILFTGDIINVEDGFDLNEISYLSLHCDTHVGRNSGPHVFAQVRRNWDDHNKLTLSFTYTRAASHFIYKLPTKMEKRWSGATETFEVYHAMCQAIRRGDV
jgi:hypothetical protein